MWGKIKEHIVSSLIGLIFTIIGGVILFHYQELWKRPIDSPVPNPLPNDQPLNNEGPIDWSGPNPPPNDQLLKKGCIYKWDKISRSVILMKKVGDSWVPASSNECMQEHER
ncbi:MAG: hypothetical protein U1F76_11580 [Candidatus Competibacteraceae bacterium]